MTEQAKATKKTTIKLVIITLAMFGFAFALVPLYQVFCDVTGLNGKVKNEAQQVSQELTPDKSRTITVQFIAHTDSEMPWEFKPATKSIDIHPGEMKIINYFAHNQSSQHIIGRAIPSVTPGQAAPYVKKVECFCFQQQPLDANEQVNMPVKFYIDKELPKEFHTVTLSYTLFKAESDKNKQQANTKKSLSNNS